MFLTYLVVHPSTRLLHKCLLSTYSVRSSALDAGGPEVHKTDVVSTSMVLTTVITSNLSLMARMALRSKDLPKIICSVLKAFSHIFVYLSIIFISEFHVLNISSSCVQVFHLLSHIGCFHPWERICIFGCSILAGEALVYVSPCECLCSGLK